jgi:hypothetical protein
MTVIKKVLKWLVAAAVVAVVMTRTTFPQQCVEWAGMGVRACESALARSHERSVAEFSATLAELDARIARAELACEVASTETERGQLQREIDDLRTVREYLRGKVGGEHLELWELSKRHDEALAENRVERGYLAAMPTPETARRIDQMQTTIADLDRRLAEMNVKGQDHVVIAKVREELQGLLRYVQQADQVATK